MTPLILTFSLASFAGTVVWPIGIWLGWRATVRVAPGRCASCGYDRAGVDDMDVCPECGVHPMAGARLIAPGAARGALVRIAIYMVGAVFAVVLLTFQLAPVIMSILLVLALGIQTAGAIAYIVPFARRVSHGLRGLLIAGAVACYSTSGVLVYWVWSVSPPSTIVIEAIAMTHVLALGTFGWIVLVSAGTAMSQRMTGSLDAHS